MVFFFTKALLPRSMAPPVLVHKGLDHKHTVMRIGLKARGNS